MLTSFFIINKNGTTIFNKPFSDSLKKNATYRNIFTTDVIIESNKKILYDISKFEKNITNHIDSEIITTHKYSLAPPILTIGTTTMIYIFRDDLFYVAVINKSEEAICIWENLNRLYKILIDLKILKSLRLKENMLKLIHIINFVINEQGIFQVENLNADSITHFLIQSY